MTNNDRMTAEQVAQALHIGKNSVYKLAQTGELASYRIGRKLFFTLADVEAYLASRRSGGVGQASSPAQRKHHVGTGTGMTENASAGANGSTNAGAQAVCFATAPSPQAPLSSPSAESERPFMLMGNDMAGDIIANYLNAAGLPTARAYEGSYRALIDLYTGNVDAALIHLYDQKTNSYNVPFVQRLAPGMPVVVLRLMKRRQGFMVKRGNPKGITTWGALLRDDVTIANRARGCGTRILLDEKLAALEANPAQVKGYDLELQSAVAVAQRVAAGPADVGLGTERACRQIAGLDFVPMQAEWLDLAIAKNERTRRLVRHLKQLVTEEAFRADFCALAQSDGGSLGTIVYEC